MIGLNFGSPQQPFQPGQPVQSAPSIRFTVSVDVGVEALLGMLGLVAAGMKRLKAAKNG